MKLDLESVLMLLGAVLVVAAVGLVDYRAGLLVAGGGLLYVPVVRRRRSGGES